MSAEAIFTIGALCGAIVTGWAFIAIRSLNSDLREHQLPEEFTGVHRCSDCGHYRGNAPCQMDIESHEALNHLNKKQNEN